MKRSTLVAVLLAALGAGCADQRLPVDAGESRALVASTATVCDATLRDAIRSQIKRLFPKTKSLQQAANSQFDNIVRTCPGAVAQAKAVDFVSFTTDKWRNHQLTSAATTTTVAHLLDDVLTYVGLKPDIPAGALGPTGVVAVIAPSTSVQTVKTGDGEAAATFPPGAVTQPVVVSIAPSADQTDPLPTGLTQFPPFYDFATSPAVTFAQPVTIGICVDYGTASQDVLDRLHLARPDAATGGTTIEVLPRVAAPSLSCPPLPGLTALAPAERGGFFGRLLAGAAALLRPAPLHAATVRLLQVGTVGGLGGTVTSFTGGSTGTVATSTACANVTEIPTLECEALVALYDSTDGPNWAVNTNWLQTNTPCSWYGVGCGGGSVVTLFLVFNRLNGVLPSELANLPALQVVALDSNQLSGSIPAGVGNLSKVLALTLGFNDLSGEIPAALGNMPALDSLRLSGNKLTGAIPSSLGNLASLNFLLLGGNQLSGSIPPELGNLGNLYDLELSRNQLSGAIPAALGTLGNLVVLELEQNQLSGAIPTELGNLGQLRSLNVSFNLLSGNLPAGLGNLTNLGFLDASHNQLTGAIPVALTNLTALHTLYLHSNQLSGAIPSELGTLSNLEILSLASNQLSGTIPAALGNLGKLRGLSLADNQLSGGIPAELGKLGNLYGFDLELNQLSGLIPLAVAQLGGKLLSGNCLFVPGNSGLNMPDTPEYRAADLDHDGFICGVGFTP